MKNQILIENNTVIKTSPPELAAIEAEKTTRAYEIAERSGLFRVPKILDYDASQGRIIFEHIPGLLNLRQAISESNYKSVMDNIGRSLSIIHENLCLPKSMQRFLPEAYQMNGTDVFIHGDFGLSNVQIIAESQQIVILDWQSTRKLDVPATYGSRCFDLMCMIYNLFSRPIGRTRYRMQVEAAQLADAFIAGYSQNSDGHFDFIQFADYMQLFLKTRIGEKRKGKHWKRLALLVPSHFKLRRYIKLVKKERQSK